MNSYLFSEEGARVPVTSVYTWYLNLIKRYMGVSWGVGDTRHGMIAVAQQYLAPGKVFADLQQITAGSSDHSVAIEEHHYAIRFDDIPRLSNLVICRTRYEVH